MPRDTLSHLRWYVVQTEPRGETRAQLELDRQGFSAWLPEMEVWARRRVVKPGRAPVFEMVSTRKPLFVGYVLIEMDTHAERWRSINGTRGVRALICQGEWPVPVRRGIVEALRETLAPTGGVLQVNTPSRAHDFRPGMRLFVKEGPGAGLRGLCTESASKRLKVLFDGMDRTAWVRADLVRAE